MTSSETPAATRPSAKKRSPAVIAVIVVVIIAVLGAGAYAVYKLTDTKDVGDPAYKVAKDVAKDVENGNTAAYAAIATPKGVVALKTLKPADFTGVTFGQCSPTAAPEPTRACIWTRPGGQVTITLARVGTNWKVDAAEIGEAGLPPTSATSSTT